jgi:cob(I)alamin adenosyltransferase
MARFHIYTGEGKGKTTTAMGMAMRALGHGQKVVIVQFLKGQETGEAMLNGFGERLIFKKFGSENFVFEGKEKDSDYTMAIDAINFVKDAMKLEPHLLILDEINCAFSMGLIPIEEGLKIIHSCPAKTELVFTGRNAPPELIEKADLVTEIKKLKHYFDNGSPSKKGIEF